MKQVLYLTNGYDGDLTYVNTYDNWAQRDGEDIWQTANHAGDSEWGLGMPWEKPMPEYGCRRCPGEVDPNSGINCIMMWLNGQVKPKYTLVSNIRVVGPDPVAAPALSIAKVGANVQVTFTGWLEAADDAQGPYTTVAVTASPYTTPAVYTAPAGAKKVYRAVN